MKKSNRHLQRIAAMQCLFQLGVQGDGFRDWIDVFLADQELDDSDRLAVRRLMDHAWTHRTEIDACISEASQHWDLGRITPVDRSILQLALGELLFLKEVPPKVVINEAIELAKEFSTAEAPHFINGLLDAIWKKQTPVSP